MNAAVQAVARARADRQARYRDLVRAAASGREIDPDEVVDILDKFGADEDQFQRDVELVAARLAADAEMRKVPALDRQVKELAAAEIAAATEFDKVAAAHAAKMADLRDRKKEIEARANALRSEHRQRFVVAPCPYPELVEERDRAVAARRPIVDKIEAVSRSIQKLRQHIQSAEAKNARGIDTPNLNLEEMRRDMAEYERRAGQFEAELREADAELARAEAALLVP